MIVEKFIQQNLLDKNSNIQSTKTKEEWFIKNCYEKEYLEILSKTEFLDSPTFPQRIYHILNSVEVRILCPNCNLKSPTFESYNKGYRTFCSPKCQSNYTKEKRNQTIIDKYGEHPFCKTSTIEKRKQTCLQKFGSEFPFQSKEIQDKQKETMLDSYGVINPSELQEVKNKKVKTYLNNWKTEYPIQSKQIQEKSKNTNIQKYGVEYFFQSDEFKESIKGYIYPTQSTGEIEVFEYIKSIVNSEIEQGNRTILKGKELDILIKDKNIAIEYCGLYWHSNKFRNNSYHKQKFNLCKEQNIRLITIFEDEWVYNKELIKTKLAHILQSNPSKKIFARKCNIKSLNNKYKSEFYNKYHIQGDGNSSINIGLYYNDELVSSIGFKKRNQGIYELDRYATKYIVVGGFNRLLNYFKSNFTWTEIITFADLRWHLGEVYQNSGFKLEKTLPPDYYYIINNRRVHKFNFRKSSIKKKFSDSYDETLSESENMDKIGILKVYDCGKIRFKLTNIN